MRFISQAAIRAGGINWGRRYNLWRLAIFVAVVAVAATAILLHQYIAENITIAQAGYAGVALTALVASGGLVIPVPALATACTVGALLNPWIVALVAGGAEGVGELTGYSLGYSGQGIVSQRPFFTRLEGWMRRRGWLVLFLVALVPNPVFDVVGVAAGALRYPLWKFLAVVWAGKIIKFGAIAYACTYSASWLMDFF
ncbi:MAG: hypothetical protein BZY80_00245 [SAR202 cluster bacterium Io17-Chloro-G2]|nr:MAG: hypothetical protein BZY80_00245 [SAR202 cluster bacterium Io17-Chloro-G2]